MLRISPKETSPRTAIVAIRASMQVSAAMPFDTRPRLPNLHSTRSRGVLESPPVLQSAAGGCHQAAGRRPSAFKL